MITRKMIITIMMTLLLMIMMIKLRCTVLLLVLFVAEAGAVTRASIAHVSFRYLPRGLDNINITLA